MDWSTLAVRLVHPRDGAEDQNSVLGRRAKVCQTRLRTAREDVTLREVHWEGGDGRGCTGCGGGSCRLFDMVVRAARAWRR